MVLELPKDSVRFDKATKKLHINIWPKQRMFLESNVDELFFGGAVGAGKALSLDAKIITPFGYTTHRDVKVGQVVCHPNGTTSKVIVVHPIEQVEMYRVTFQNGTSVKASANHLWRIWFCEKVSKRESNETPCLKGENLKGRVVTTLCLKDLIETGYYNVKIPVTQPVVSCVQDVHRRMKLHPYFLGLLLGDGCISGKKISIHCDDREIVSWIRKYSGYEVVEEPNARGAFWFKNPAVLRDELMKWNLYGTVSNNKFIPLEYRMLPLEARWELVRGLMDTDGYACEKGKIQYTTVSKELAKHVRWVCHSLGARVTMTEKIGQYRKDGVVHKCQKVYLLYIQSRDNSKFFKLSRKRNRCLGKKFNGGVSDLGNTVTGVTSVGVDVARCITVDHPDGLYLTDDFIVTHNSEVLLLFCLQRRLQHPKTLGVIFRRTFPELQKSLILRSHRLYPLVGATYNQTTHEWRFPNGSIQSFAFCDAENDVYKHWSSEYHDMCFDELSSFTEFQFKYLLSRVRSALPGVKPLVRSASNPGQVGHNFVKRRYIEPAKMQNKWYLEDEKKWLSFIPATMEDNPSLQLNDPNYESRLKIMGEKKYQALRFGDWEIFEGQFFSEWDSRPGQTVLVAPRIPSKYHIKFLSMDWGYATRAAVHWWEVTPSGRVFVYREYYPTRRTSKELAKDILDLSPEEEIYDYMSAPPEIFGKETEREGGGEPIADEMQQVFGKRIRMQKANNARIPGWMKLRQYLMKAQDGFPWLQISPVCKNTIRTVPDMVHDEHIVEDLNKKGESHCSDSLRYGAVSLSELPKMLITPTRTFADAFFGTQNQRNELTSAPEMKGRSGYGF